MSIIKRYQAALRHRTNPRYMTKDFIVPLYTGTEPDIYEDKKPNMNDPGMVVDPSRILPKNFTDDMPFVTDENNTEQLELADGGRVELGEGGLSQKGRKIAKIVYGLKDSEIDSWAKNPVNKIKVYRINKGITTKETKATGITPGDPNRIIVQAPRGSEKVSNIIFPNKKIEKNFLKEVKKKFSSPVSASEITFSSLADNFPISEKQAGRAVRYLGNKLGLEYPKGTSTKEYYSPEAKKERYGDVTSRKMEEKISKIKTPILKEADLSKKIDLAHRVSKRHMNRLGIQFNTDTVGMDSRLINQIIVRPSEFALKNLYNKQYSLFNTAKKSRLTSDISNKLNEVNSKIINEVEKTSGRLIGVIVDPDTLETSFHGLKKKLSLDSKGIDLKQLEKMSLEKQTDYLSKVVPKAINAEIDRGFIPKDFEKILSNPGRQESIIKYAKRTAPELIPQLKQIFKDPGSTKSIEIYSGAVPGLEQMIKTPAGRALGTLFTSASKITGAPFNAALGAVLNTSEMREKGLGRLDSVLLGATKGATQDLANFGTYVARTPEALYKTFKEDPGTKKVRLEQFLENLGEEKFKFIDEFADKASERLNTKEYIDNLAQLEYEKELEKVMPSPSISETELFDTDQYLNEDLFKKDYRNKLFKQNPELKEEYNYVNKEPSVTPEGLFNFNVTDLTQPQELEEGGRVGFAEGSGPKFTRRGMLGVLGAIAATPLVKSLMKGESKALKAVKLIPKSAGMPEWFPSLVSKIEKEGKFLNKDIGLEDNLKIKRLIIPSKTGKGGDEIYTMIQHSNGDIVVEANVKGGAFDAPFELHYKPPKSDIDVTTGKAINEPGEFNVMENRPRSTAASHHDSDYEIDYDLVSYDQAISDVERAERVATGKRIHPKRVQEREAARKYVEENPYDDIVNRYGDYNYKDVDYE
jgi:hypothetical protein